MASDFYATLGVSRSATADEIKKSFRKLAAKLHPDKNQGSKSAEAQFKEVTRAHDVLGDPKKRALYDEFGEDALREGFDPERVRQYRSWGNQQQSPFGRGGGGGQTFNIEDFLRGAGGGQAVDFGGGGAGDVFGDMFSGGRRRRRGPSRGADQESQFSIDFVTAVKGGTLTLRKTESDEPIMVRIPPGADEGNRLRIPGQGAPDPGGGPRGDLILVIHVLPHPYFRREKNDLHLDLPLRPGEAYSGAKVKVPTPDGAVTLKVPPHSQSGQVTRLKGKGIVRKNDPPGDLYVHFQIHVPGDESEEIAAAVEVLDRAIPADLRDAIQF